MFNKLKNMRAKKIVAGVSLATATAVASTAGMASTALTPSTADYSFTIENKYKGTATRTLTKSGNSWNYKVNARVAGVATAIAHIYIGISATLQVVSLPPFSGR